MNTKNKNVQGTLDLQMEDTVTIEKETKKTSSKANKEEKKSASKDNATKAEKPQAKKKPVAKKATMNATMGKKEKASKAETVKKGEEKLEKQTIDKKEKSLKTKPKKAVTEKSSANKDTKKVAVKPKKAPTKKKSTDKEIEKTNSDTIMTDEKAVIVEDIKRFKLYFVSDMDEEAVYLHEMSLQGYHFLTKKGMQYLFRQGEPKNYFYHLGYYEKDKRDGERYLDNYTDAGWENIYHEKAEFDGVWNYFRIEMPIGEAEPNIFSDRESRLALYKRLLSSWRTLLAVDIICFFFTLFFYIFLTNHPMNMIGVYKTLCAILVVIIVAIFAIYFRAYLKISRKQQELEKI